MRKDFNILNEMNPYIPVVGYNVGGSFGLISVFILSLAPSNPTNTLSSTPSVSADALAASQSEPSYARSPHDVAAVLRWGLRHLKLEGNSFGRPALNPTSPSTNTHTTSSDVNNNTFTDDELSWYTSFSRAERSSNYPPTAFSQSLVPLLPEDHAELLVALLDVISSLAAHGEANGSSGAKFSMMIGLRLVAASRSKSRDGWVSFYERWEKVGRVLGHLLLARIREEASTHKMPRRLTELVEHYPYTKDTVVLALGGGVIGDLVGFVAATFMRGCRFVQILTTLLAMVDSSAGGKTAIDTPHGKNLIGAFWQPEYIFIDTAAIWDENEFAALESRSAEIFATIRTPSQNYSGRTKSTRSAAQDLLLSVIAGSISVKAHIVTNDERELTGFRDLVNFGHTIGHAIEAILTPNMLHGECVAVGMILEAEVARQLGKLGQHIINLPVSLTDPHIASLPSSRLLTVDRLLDIMKIDNTNSGPEKKIVILSAIGKTCDQKASVVKDSVIAKTLSEAAKVVPGKPSQDPIRMATPGSESISNRALVLAALGKGTCRLSNLLHSDDTQVMMAAPAELKGASFAWEDGGETLVVHGGEGFLSVPPKGKEIYLGNAGTAARFLTTVCALIQPSVLAPTTIITGNARMKQRPIGPLVDALRANDTSIEYLESQGCLPLSIAPAGLKRSRIQLAATVSSQYVSSILLCAPYTAEQVTLELTGGQVISQPYIDMTIAMMKTFGIEVQRETDAAGKLLDVYTIQKGTYTNPSVYSIESDASSATYPLAIAVIAGSSCTICNIGSSSLQGDARFAKEVLEPMGCEVVQTETETTVRGPKLGTLKAIGLIDMEPMTDAFLTASVLAAVAAGAPLEGRELVDGSPTSTTRIIIQEALRSTYESTAGDQAGVWEVIQNLARSEQEGAAAEVEVKEEDPVLNRIFEDGTIRLLSMVKDKELGKEKEGA
ncbi:uncharacterized protein STEHIDRAFT_159248 [Stereum hirsutum FP-91666 SS1]|uniref:uncharacterized protein n=1 Tax=Stereum hirsutum (strain FP-91666) TaxID=721885 RepID=UPI00044495B1|nr:uncharacterized protein STEHIDRAFT_159248 [Stereum hirsutum FP-91666 SS1]EIM84582.1 hypothetical protein STEHIDRAFT_159248 [Stereum hirsutum FP-91666 SS1]